MIVECGEVQWFISEEGEFYFYVGKQHKTPKQFRAWLAKKERSVVTPVLDGNGVQMGYELIDSPIRAIRNGTNQPTT